MIKNCYYKVKNVSCIFRWALIRDEITVINLKPRFPNRYSHLGFSAFFDFISVKSLIVFANKLICDSKIVAEAIRCCKSEKFQVQKHKQIGFI